MTDRKPPRVVSGELATLLALLQYQRTSLVDKVQGVTAEQAVWSPVPSGTSLLWLITHMAEAEQTWVVRRFAGTTSGADEAPPTGADPLSSAVDRYRRGWAEVDALVAGAAGPDEPCRDDVTHPPVTLRWVVAHLLEETARHAGHADILRELIDGSVGR